MDYLNRAHLSRTIYNQWPWDFFFFKVCMQVRGLSEVFGFALATCEFQVSEKSFLE